jgi:Cu/Ag efflux protein CusF
MIKHGVLTLCVLSGLSFSAMAAEPEMSSGFQRTGENTVSALNSLEMQAQVVSVDKKTREIQLKTEDGEITPIIAGPEVKNFSQIKKGDILKVHYMESLALELKKGGKEPIEVTRATDIDRAQVGQKPGAAVVDKVTSRGTVTKIDPKTQSVTVKGPNRTVTFRVEKKDLFNKIKTGDQIEATYTEAMAISVETVKK